MRLQAATWAALAVVACCVSGNVTHHHTTHTPRAMIPDPAAATGCGKHGR